jgi:hypothetical protein
MRYSAILLFYISPVLINPRSSSIPKPVANGIVSVRSRTLVFGSKIMTSNPAHFMHLPTGLTYNAAKPTVEAFQTPKSAQHLPTLERKKIPIKLKTQH